MTSIAGPLLPPFVPLPAISTTFQTTPPALFEPFPSQSRPSSPLSNDTPIPTAVPSPAGSPTTSASSAFFSRLRSNSLHSSEPSTPSLLRSDSSIPPVPALPSTPTSTSWFRPDLNLSPPSSRKLAASSRPSSASLPLIKSVTVPHHSKSGKNWLFGCRVVPVQDDDAKGKARSKRNSLGRMEMANEREPYTVYRSWSECVDFSTRLTMAFPDDRAVTSDSPLDLPSSFYRQVPRLSKKLVLFMTRSTLVQRQAELDLFCRRLFQMSDDVKHSCVVRDFFRLRDDDVFGTNPAPMPSGTRVDYDAPENLPHLLDSSALASPNATVKAPKPKARRPALAVKVSTPNLRGAFGGFGDDLEATSPASETAKARTALAARTFMLDANNLRTSSKYSMVSESSTSSSATVTPTMLAAQGPARQPSPLAMAATPVPSPTITSAPFKSLKKKASGPLRHFRSLQDLRGGSNASLEVPDEPVPTLKPAFAAAAMARASTQSGVRAALPSLSTTGAPVRLSSGPQSAPLTSRHRRTGSSKSSVSSIEDLWGTAQPLSIPTTIFRQAPSGRLESVPLDEARRSQSPSYRRPSMPGRGGSCSTNKASCGHSSSPSISSLDSARSSGRSSFELSGSFPRSGRNSFDWSNGSENCPTPPTPQSDWGNTQTKEATTAGKYYIENGVLAQNNTVPPPPFFPVPPPMTAAYSYDGLPHTPRSSHARKSSLENSTSSRSRAGSTASRRLDSILASPSIASSSCCSSPTSGPDLKSCWTFKLLHSSENVNVVLRIKKEGLTLAHLRSEIRNKFKASGVDLAGAEDAQSAHWGLAYTPKSSEQQPEQEGATTRLLIQQEDLERCLAEQQQQVGGGTSGKITFKVVC
ncbi:hypothetical protein JCM1841_006395 [Sporobolomyces salmonicolor]